jgi:hypothetical protein
MAHSFTRPRSLQVACYVQCPPSGPGIIGNELCSATSNQLEPLNLAVCACRAIDQFVSDFKAKGLPLYCE